MNNQYTKGLNSDDLRNIEEHNFWLFRNNHFGNPAQKMLGFQNDKFTVDNGCYISIGCHSGMLDIDDYNAIATKSGDSNKFKKFEEIYINKVRSKLRIRHFLYKFLFEFKNGDYLLIPGKGDFHVFQIIDEKIIYFTELEKELEKADTSVEEIQKENKDFKFFRRVVPVRINMSRKEYAHGKIASRLKFRGTISLLNDDVKSELIKVLKQKNPFSFYKNAIPNLIKELHEQMNNSLTPDDLEKLLLWYFKKINASDAYIPSKNSSEKEGYEDADVVATFDQLNIVIYAQVKNYEGKANLSWAKEQISEYKKNHENPDDDYTYIAWILCKTEKENIEELETNEIRVISGEEFAEMLLQAGLQNIDDALM